MQINLKWCGALVKAEQDWNFQLWGVLTIDRIECILAKSKGVKHIVEEYWLHLKVVICNVVDGKCSGYARALQLCIFQMVSGSILMAPLIATPPATMVEFSAMY